MRSQQESIHFPIRKTRLSNKSTKQHNTRSTRANSTDVEIQEIQKSPRSPGKSAVNLLSSPSRCSRKVEDQLSSPLSYSRRARKPVRDVVKNEETYRSPQRSSCPIGSPKSLGSPARQLFAGEAPVLSSPSKITLCTADIENILSPRKRLVVALTPLEAQTASNIGKLISGEKSDSIPLSPIKCTSPISTSQRGPDFRTPQKSPLSSSSLANIRQGTQVRLESASKSAVKRLNLSSPAKSPIRSPIRCLNVTSPRRSPRKIGQENVLSPMKSPRKLAQSPLCFTSPTSLMSRVALNSPESRKKNIAISLFKPDVTAYRSLRQSLNTGTPTVLVGRERQVSEMREFLMEHLQQGNPGSLYVSGAPGTGKTASLNSIIDSMQVKKLKRVFLNCMTLKTSAAIYKAILKELNLCAEGSERENRAAIERAVTSSKNTMLLMLDEVDQLDSKNQEVLYTIFEWPALAGSRLVLVGIANSLDLTDRILPRLQARPNFRPRLLHYPPYTKPEIVNIINHRISEAGLGDMQVIRPAAIQLLAGKVASVAGDARKALDVCRRAVELCEGQARRQAVLTQNNGSPRKNFKLVEIPQVLSIFNEVYGSRVISAVTDAPESFPLQQKILLCCLILMLKHGRSKDVTLGKFHDVYKRVCRKRQVPGMDQSEFLSLCTLLEARGMLQVKTSKEIRSSKVLLRLNIEEAEQTLGDRNLLASVLEDKESLGKLCKK